MKHRLTAMLHCSMMLPLAAALTLDSASAATPNDIVSNAPSTAWQAIDPQDLVVLMLDSGKQVVIQLAPRFAPIHAANIRALVKAGWFDGAAVTRVQDNYVVQWARTARKPLPPGVTALPPAEYERAAGDLAFRPLGFRDAYAAETGHVDGWPVGREGGKAWLVHCYGMVGVGRDNSPDTGDGTELYAVIGHAPRHLDRNIALVGRVVGGIENWSARPRGTGALGFYEDPSQYLAIRAARMASDLPPDERPAFQVMDQKSPEFAKWVDARANRKDDFFVRPAGAVDICNAQAPVRQVK